MQNVAVFKILILALALCLVVGAVIGVHRSLDREAPIQTDPPETIRREITPEEIKKMTTDELVFELMESEFCSYILFSSSQEQYECALRDNPMLTEILERADGPAALAGYYRWNKDEDLIKTYALKNLFESETFKEAVGQEEYDRLFPE